MDCKETECMYNKRSKCTSDSTLNEPNKGKDCLGFDYDCIDCQEIGFRHYDCSDCCLSEEEYYGEEDM